MPDIATPSPIVQELVGGHYVAMLQQHLLHLRDAYDHGNRKLFYDELVTAYLLLFFNPAGRSLRAIEDLSQTTWAAAAALGKTRKLCRSTMSDANALMDAKLLEPIIRRLKSRVRDLKKQDGLLARLLEQVRIIDGSFFASAANVAWALKSRRRSKNQNKKNESGKKREATFRFKVRLDLHLDGATRVPTRASVHGKGTSESASASQQIEPFTIHVTDRGFASLKYIQELLDANADFVMRVKQEAPNFQSREDQPLDEQDREANVLSDRIGRLTGSPHTRAKRVVPSQELREVVVFDPDHPDKPIRLITSLLDVPAHVIAQLYRWRWQIELFFRWLKVHAHFEHLISRSKNGLTLGFYVAVIAVLLIYLRTGRPMSKYAYNLLSLVASGVASVEEILPILERRERECERDRQRQRARLAGKRAAKTSV